MAVAYLLVAAYFALADVGAKVLPDAPPPPKVERADLPTQQVASAQAQR
jgi:hypothetical protein